MPLIMIIAGEASGDLHASNLVRSMKRICPEVEFLGVGGDRMKEAGVHVIVPFASLAVVGFTEVVRRLGSFVRAYVKLRNILRRGKIDLLILVDFPDFNLHVAGIAKDMGIPVFYYISPQVWAWRRGRVKKISQRVDRMAVVLPFEEEFYEKRGVKVDFVGHPLIDVCQRQGDVDPVRVKKSLGMKDCFPVVGLIPGSRREEVFRLLPPMLEAASILKRRFRSVQYCLPLSSNLERSSVMNLLSDKGLDITVVGGNKIYEILSVCDAAVVASGTATLETALMEVPMVVVYRGSWLSFMIARSLVSVPYISLVNLISEREVVPELIQDQVDPARIASLLTDILDDNALRSRMLQGFREMKMRLGKEGASDRAARIAIGMLKGLGKCL